jgi:hypothetical protein
MAIKYTNLFHCNFPQIRIFGFENIPPGNPVIYAD